MKESNAAQLLAEMMIKRKADRERKTLTEQFWNTLTWKKEFIQQKIAAYALLKLYSYDAILAALNHKDIKWVYSLRTKCIIPYIKDESVRLKGREEKAIEAEKIVVVEDRGVDVMINKRSRIGKLD